MAMRCVQKTKILFKSTISAHNGFFNGINTRMMFALAYNAGPNLGDDIQTLAARQYLPQVDVWIDREKIAEAQAQEGTKCIMNGWYMHNPRQWPPAKNIRPFFISFHGRPAGAQNVRACVYDAVLGRMPQGSVLDVAHREYYAAHAPIGCRDIATRDAIQALGVSAEFSGCLTLTLQRPDVPRGEKIVFSDPFGTVPLTTHRYDIWCKLPKEMHQKAKKVTHLTLQHNVQKRMRAAEKLLEAYASGTLVVTARLHAALPCLAFRTPVIFLDIGHRTERFSGYETLLKRVRVADFITAARAGDVSHLISAPDVAQLTALQQKMRQRTEAFIAD